MMTEVKRGRGHGRISHETALKKLALRHFGHKPVHPRQVSKAFNRAFPRVIEKRFRQSERNLELFKRYWGFGHYKACTASELAKKFSLSEERVYVALQGMEGRLAHLAREELKNL